MSGDVKKRERAGAKHRDGLRGDAALSASGLSMAVAASGDDETYREMEQESVRSISYRLTSADLMRMLGQLRVAAGIPAVFIFIDEFSALNEDLQRRFTTLLRKIIGNHQGIFVKLSGITDNYTLGSSIILQRDLFELSLDLDSFVERSGSLNAAIAGLASATEQIVTQRLKTYIDVPPDQVFDDAADAWTELSRAVMGVPRTLGIILKHAWYRSQNARRARIGRGDIEYGIRAASRAYLSQLTGAAKDGLAAPTFVYEMWDALISRAIEQRSKVRGVPASHFMVLPRNQSRLKWLNMFFVVHLLTEGRTTKKERHSRSLYCFDYGICMENNLGFTTDKNVLRQQRFAFDDVLREFDRYFESMEEQRYMCPKCGAVYDEKDLYVAGQRLQFCPKDKYDLIEHKEAAHAKYTEEEVKIIGAIRSAQPKDRLTARTVADDVGCYVQKVAKFGERLDREELIERQRLGELRRIIYYNPESAAG